MKEKQNSDEMGVKLGGPTLRNDDIIRQSYAIKTFARTFKETIEWFQP